MSGGINRAKLRAFLAGLEMEKNDIDSLMEKSPNDLRKVSFAIVGGLLKASQGNAADGKCQGVCPRCGLDLEVTTNERGRKFISRR